MGKPNKYKQSQTLPFVSLSNDIKEQEEDCIKINYSEKINAYEKQLEQKSYLIDELLKKVKTLTNELSECTRDRLSNNDVLNAEINNLKMELEKNIEKIDKLSWFIVKTGVDYSEISLFE